MANRPLWSQKQSVFPGAIGSKAANFSGVIATTAGFTTVAAVTGKKIRLRAFNVNIAVSVAVNSASASPSLSLAFVDSTYGTGVLWQVASLGVAAAATTVPILTGLVVIPMDGPVFETTAGNALAFAPSVTVGSAGIIAVSGTVFYDEI